MDENKLVSGGIIFALSSIATYSYHQMINQNTKKNNKKNNKKNKRKLKKPIMEPIMEENEGSLPPNNTPIMSLTPNMKSVKVIEHKEPKPIVEKEDPPTGRLRNKVSSENKSNSITMSSFFELNNTGSLTNTEELEFTKIEHKKDFKIYGSPECYKPKLKLINTDKGYSSERGEYDSDSDDIQVTYYSEGELLKNKSKIFRYFRRRKTN